mgnify:CR=1 FL=1
MPISKRTTSKFDLVLSHIQQTYNSLEASGAALMIIHNDEIAAEMYLGKHSNSLHAEPIQENSQFHVASVRKSYIGLAVAHAIYHKMIHSVDDEIIKYLPDCQQEIFKGVTIKHLLTHTHGLRKIYGTISREFALGEDWKYRRIGTELLTEIVEKATGETVAQIIQRNVLEPLQLKETGWYSKPNNNLVKVLRGPHDLSWSWSSRTDGSQMNMYVSARDLAKWGYLHLKEGKINGQQIVPAKIIKMATSLQTPRLLDSSLPRNGFFWFLQDFPSPKTELGEQIPIGSYQILGYTGVALLVIPKHNLVAVRMFNRFGSPLEYDYLKDIRSFGNTIMTCLTQ